MAKQPPVTITPDIIQTPLEDVMHKSMMPYAEYVILERAIPRVEDGLKPVQRRILYTMSELGLTPDKPHRKCARIVGDCLGKYHPHGDTSVYDALTRMAQSYSLRGTMVDGHGNFGSIDGDSPAAMRYTEARMAPLALQMLRDIEKDTVPFRLNFDDTLKEPDLLPARFPNLLVNGASGIAVGLATNIPPHNLREVAQAACMMMDDENISLDELMKVVPGPDFPTGGILLNTPEIRAAYETGKGKMTLRARVHIEDSAAGRHLLVITEIPYGIPKAAMLEKILQLSEEKKNILGCIHDIRDESDRSGLRAVIELKKEADPQAVLAYLYKYSDLQITFGANMVAVAAGKPVLMGFKTILQHFIRHQKDVVTRRTKYELEQAQARAHILEGLIVAVDNLDEVIALIRASKNGKEARAKLVERFSFTEIQAQAILDLRLQRLTNLEILALREEYAELQKTIANLQAILKSEKKLLGVIKKELKQIADEMGDDRRTEIITEGDKKMPELVVPELPPEEAVVFLTRGGLLRRMSPKVYEKLEPPTRPGDMPRFLYRTDTRHTLLLMTNLGNCYSLNVDAIPEAAKLRERGGALNTLLTGLETGEGCVSMLLCAPGSLNGMSDFLFFTKTGQVKRSISAEYDLKRSRFSAINLKNGDELVAAMWAEEKADLLMITQKGQSIRFAIDSVPVVGRVAAGVRGMKVDDDDRVIYAAPIHNQDEVLLLTERGYGKRIMGSMFVAQGRAGKGVKAIYFNKSGSTGTIVAALARITAPQTVQALMTSGSLFPIESDAFPNQDLPEKGKPIVMAVLDDIVQDIIL